MKKASFIISAFLFFLIAPLHENLSAGELESALAEKSIKNGAVSVSRSSGTYFRRELDDVTIEIYAVGDKQKPDITILQEETTIRPPADVNASGKSEGLSAEEKSTKILAETLATLEFSPKEKIAYVIDWFYRSVPYYKEKIDYAKADALFQVVTKLINLFPDETEWVSYAFSDNFSSGTALVLASGQNAPFRYGLRTIDVLERLVASHPDDEKLRWTLEDMLKKFIEGVGLSQNEDRAHLYGKEIKIVAEKLLNFGKKHGRVPWIYPQGKEILKRFAPDILQELELLEELDKNKNSMVDIR